MKPLKSESQSEIEMLRRLAQEKREAEQQREKLVQQEGDSQDQLWSKKRAEYGAVIVEPARQEVLRVARKAAQRGDTALKLDLGVDEKRLRASSPTGAAGALNMADAVLAPKAIESPSWAYLSRVGWVLQARDGKSLTQVGEALVEKLREMGFAVSFTPFHTQDSYAEPFCNAKLHLAW